MIKYIFISLILIVKQPCFSQAFVSVQWSQHNPSLKSDTIYYDTHKKLNWKDFKGKPDAHNEATAITSSGFGYAAAMQYRNGKTSIEIAVFCYFSKTNSWVKTESDYALNHEQHHFDVTYIATNRFIQKLKNATFTRNNYDSLLEKIYRENCRELEKMQNEYDGQTRNGRLKNIQAYWNEKIIKQLSLL